MVVTDGAASAEVADCVVPTVICVGLCGCESSDAVTCVGVVADSIVGGIDCVGKVARTVCVVDPVVIGGVVCSVVVTDPRCVDVL